VTELENHGDKSKKKIVLRSSEPKLVDTTRGQLNARHVAVKDIGTFSKILSKGDAATSSDYEELGKLALLTLVSAPGDMECLPALTEETLETLSAADVVALARAVAEACDLEASSSVNSLKALGNALFDSLSEVTKQISETSAKIERTIGQSFRTLSDTLQSDLGNRFSELSSIRNALGTSAAVEALGKSHSTRIGTLGTVTAGLTIPPTSSLTSIPRTPSLDAFRPPKFEETAAGRTAARAASASEESAKQLNEVAGLMGTMTEKMAGLHTVFLSEVLPKWNADLQDSADATNTTLRQAKSSLFWAKWALVASVVVSILLTTWQVWQAREYKLENDKQQERSERLMTEQLKAVLELNKQIAKQAQQNEISQQVPRGSAGASREVVTRLHGKPKEN